MKGNRNKIAKTASAAVIAATGELMVCTVNSTIITYGNSAVTGDVNAAVGL